MTIMTLSSNPKGKRSKNIWIKAEVCHFHTYLLQTQSMAKVLRNMVYKDPRFMQVSET